jgi:prophage antirepressor-like protein
MTLAVFSFGNQEVRTVTDEHGEIWFVANDVCAALELGNPRQAIASHVDEVDVRSMDTPTPGGMQAVNHVNESGLYALIFGSRKEAAKRFKRWVTSEVLPAIRKNGYYASNESTSLQQPAAAETVDAVMRVVGGMAQNLRLDTDDYLMLLRYSLGKYDQKLAEIVPQELLTARASIPMDAQWGVDTSFDLAGLLEDFGSVFLDVDSFLHRMMVCGVVAERTVYDEQTQSLIRQKRLQNTYFGINCGSGRNAIIGWYRDRFRQALALATNVR